MSNKVGKPLAFPTVESLQEAVDAYFAKDGESWDMTGEYPRFLPTMSGLALALNVDRKTVLNYSNKDEYFPTIRKARAIIENNLEKNLYGNNVTGLIFNLKNNFGWNDKQELDHTSNGKTLNNWSVNPVTTSKE
jgi:hypothetical protein